MARIAARDERWDAIVEAVHVEVATSCERGEAPNDADADGCMDRDAVAARLGISARHVEIAEVSRATERLLRNGRLVACESGRDAKDRRT